MGIDISVRLPFIATVLASKLGALNLKPLTVAISGVEALALYLGKKDIQKFQAVYKMQTLFNCASLAATFWSFGHLVNELGKKYSVFNMNLTWMDLVKFFDNSSNRWRHEHKDWSIGSQLLFGAWGYGAIVAGVAALVLGVKKANKIHASYQVQHTKDKQVTMSWDRPMGQKFAQWVYIARLSINLALTALSPSRLYFAVNAALSGYALYEMTQRKWLCVSRERDWNYSLTNTRIEKVIFVYRCFLMPFSSKNNENCTICQHQKPDAYFHGEHVFHEECLVDYVVDKIDGIDIQRFDRSEGQTSQGNRIITYVGSMPSTQMPICPNCRHKPIYNELDVIVRECGSATIAKINWI